MTEPIFKDIHNTSTEQQESELANSLVSLGRGLDIDPQISAQTYYSYQQHAAAAAPIDSSSSGIQDPKHPRSNGNPNYTTTSSSSYTSGQPAYTHYSPTSNSSIGSQYAQEPLQAVRSNESTRTDSTHHTSQTYSSPLQHNGQASHFVLPNSDYNQHRYLSSSHTGNLYMNYPDTFSQQHVSQLNSQSHSPASTQQATYNMFTHNNGGGQNRQIRAQRHREYRQQRQMHQHSQSHVRPPFYPNALEAHSSPLSLPMPLSQPELGALSHSGTNYGHYSYHQTSMGNGINPLSPVQKMSNGLESALTTPAPTLLDTFSAKDYVPLNISTWEKPVVTPFHGPYKPLLLTKESNLEDLMFAKLHCRGILDEFAPISRADAKYNNGVITKGARLRDLLRTGGTTRVFLQPGMNHSSTVGPITEKDILSQCAQAVYASSGTTSEMEIYLAPSETLVQAGREPSRGIPRQRDLPAGVSVIMDARHKNEIENTFMKWGSNRPRAENFFKMEDKKGVNFSLEELKEALDILMSRPPRRINHYVARQMLTDVSFGQGRGVTEFNTSTRHLHMMSRDTRIPNCLAPAGIIPTPTPNGKTDIVQQTMEQIKNRDLPYINTKKSNQYDPCYCRRQGIEKEGWCGICKGGGWFLMKNSGYLYHENHEHGIFPGGFVFEDPLVIRRKVSREARWEGMCGICYHWVDLDHTDRKLWGTWYRHYKLCVNEYEEIKKLLRTTCMPIELIEIKYAPGGIAEEF